MYVFNTYKHKEMNIKLLLICVTFFLASTTAFSRDDEDCTYVVYVKTGEIHNAGTYAKVSLELKDIYLNRVSITTLSSHGVMGKWHDYFQRGNLDAFAVKAKCLRGPVCSVTLSHDNSGLAPGWYVDYVDVTAISPHRGCRKTQFPLGGWLAVNKAPFKTSWGVYLCDEIVHSKCSSES